MPQDPSIDAAQRSRQLAWRRGVGLLVMTALAPGSAQLVAGGRGLGRFALRVWLGLWVLAVCGAVALVFRRDIVVTVYTHPVTQ